MGLTVGREQGRAACAESVEAFVRAVDGFGELELLAGSRCHGWTRLDVVTHVIAGWQEMVGGLVTPDDGPPTVDAASYWPAFATGEGDSDPVDVLMSQRRRSAAYARPASAVAHLHDVADALLSGIASFAHEGCRWQGHVFGTGDYLAIWAVEDVVHHLDLLSEHPAPAAGLALTRATAEALLGSGLPAGWSDEVAALVTTGRLREPSWERAGQMPLLG